jgi:hypothetical protein
MAESFNDGIGDNEANIRREEYWDYVNGRARRSTSTYDEAMQFNINSRNEGYRAVESEFIPSMLVAERHGQAMPIAAST